MADEPRDHDSHDPEDHLKRVRERLQLATGTADRPIDTQLNSITAGVFEEQAGEEPRSDEEPKADRIAEVAEKLDGLADEAAGETAEHVRIARDHCYQYLGEDGGDRSTLD